jgi:hypothetical protein
VRLTLIILASIEETKRQNHDHRSSSSTIIIFIIACSRPLLYSSQGETTNTNNQEMEVLLLGRFEALPLTLYTQEVENRIRGFVAGALMSSSLSGNGDCCLREEDRDSRALPSSSPSPSETLSASMRLNSNGAGGIFRYDPDAFVKLLSTEVPWRELCRDHDSRKNMRAPVDSWKPWRARRVRPSSNDEVSSITPLQIVLACLGSDGGPLEAVLPPACDSALVRALLGLFVFLRREDDDDNDNDEERCGEDIARDYDSSSPLASLSRLSPSRLELIRSAAKGCQRIPGLSLPGAVVGILEEELLPWLVHGETCPSSAPRVEETRRIVSLVLALCTKGGSDEEETLLHNRTFVGDGLAPSSFPGAIALRALVLALALVDFVEDMNKRNRTLAESTVHKQRSSDLAGKGPQESHDLLVVPRRRCRTIKLSLFERQQLELWHEELSVDDDPDNDDDRAQSPRSDNEDDDRDRGHRLVRNQRRYRPSLSLRDIRATSPTLERIACHHDTSRRRKRLLNYFRSQLMRTFFGHILPSYPHLSIARPELGTDVLHVLLVPELSLQPQSSSLRLLVVLCTAAMLLQHNHQQKHSVIKSLLNDLWERISTHIGGTHHHHRSMGIGLLHCYAEVVAECAWFDDPRVLSCALHPLVESALQEDVVRASDAHTTSSNNSENDRNHDGALNLDATAEDGPDEIDAPSESFMHCVDQAHDQQTKPGNESLPYRCALAYVLSRRGTRSIMKSLALLKLSGFRSGVEAWTHLALSYGRWADWFHEAWHDDRTSIRFSLQAVGVLGICDSNTASLSKVCSASQRSRRYKCRMRAFATHCCRDIGLLRSLVLADSHPLFSNGSGTESLKAPTFANRMAQSSLPFRGHLSDDVVRHVFGFLGYKRLTRMREVCRGWREVADDPRLWQQAYASRFGAPRIDGKVRVSGLVSSGSPSGFDWKSLFASKLAAERLLRFRRHSSGWKVRTCRYLGCLQVLTTPRQAERHGLKHQRSSGAPNTSKRKARVSTAKATANSSCKRPKRETRRNEA